MTFNFKHLAIEVTRRCNMNCAHCMRGDSQEVNLDTSVLQKLFEYAGSIKHLTITGGEPSLNPSAIRYISYFSRNVHCEIGAFFCSTNAKEYSEEFVNALNELYEQCTDKQNCTLSISLDQFHDAADPTALSEYRKLPYYQPVKELGNISRGNILSEGRANENNLGRYSKPFAEYFYDIDYEPLRFTVGDSVYLNAVGDILLDCDLSYLNQEEENIGNIMETPLDKLIMSNHFKIPEHWCEGANSVYLLHLQAEAGTIADIDLEDKRYYALAYKASAAYHSFLDSIRIHPVNPACGPIPDYLELKFSAMPQNEERCDGTVIRYVLPEQDTPKKVTIEVIRCPLEDGISGLLKKR